MKSKMGSALLAALVIGLATVVWAGPATIKTTAGSIIIQGSGSGNAGPVTFDQAYYIVKAKYQSSEQYSMLQATYKVKLGGTDIEKNLAFAAAGAEVMRVFQPEKQGQASSTITFQVKSEGSYTIELMKPPAVTSVLSAPQTFSGGQGWMMTPLVKTKGNYVMLRIKYTGKVDPNKKGGLPLASATLYDAATGDDWVRNQSVYNSKPEEQDGHTGSKPGVYFALVSCSQAGGTWEVAITE
jgi:hypothetical protein